MLSVIIPLIIQAAPVQQSPIIEAQPVSVPMTRLAWDSLTSEQKVRYSTISVQALKRSPMFMRCDALNPDTLEIKINEIAEEGSPLMMGVALAAYTLCDEVSDN